MAATNSKSSGKSAFVERYLTTLAVIVGAIIIAVAFAFGHGTTPTTTSNSGTTAPAVNIAKVKTSGEPYVGNASAPVTMALFFDYQCPFCKQFDATVVQQLYTNYVQTGKLKIVFKDFDFIGPDSLTASEFARALWQLYPNQFYAWYNGVYTNQLTESHTADSTYLPHLKQIAGQLSGVDVNKVVTLMNQNKTQYDATAQADFAEGQSYGIQGTPSVIIGTTLLQGAQSYQTVAALVDAQLKK